MGEPRVTVLTMGGTISMTGSASTGVAPSLSGADLVGDGDGLAAIAAVEARSFRTVPGAHLTLDDLVALADEVDACAEAGSAVVVTTGTDTLEELAFALDVLVDVPVPVIVTGAMRNPTLPGADGPANVRAAVVAAAAGADLGGVGVLLGDELHAARLVAKRHATRPAAFASADAGPVGAVVEDELVVHSRVPRLPLSVPRVAATPHVRVPILTLGLGDDGLLLRLAGEHADGVVVECFGAGHVPPWVLDDLGQVAAAVPVVVTSRTRAGRLLRGTYGFPGSERDVLARGTLAAGSLDAVKARILLALLVRGGVNRHGVEACFRVADAAR